MRESHRPHFPFRLLALVPHTSSRAERRRGCCVSSVAEPWARAHGFKVYGQCASGVPGAAVADLRVVLAFTGPAAASGTNVAGRPAKSDAPIRSMVCSCDQE